jgi:hypothetical protein
MAIERTKKVVIKKADLPAYSGENQSYIVRYRVVSEDKNRTSHWSPQYRLPVSAQSLTTDHSISVNVEARMINVVWQPQASSGNNFDVYVKWDNDSYAYVGSVTTPMYTGLIKNGASSVKVAVQVPTFPKQRFTSATMFETTSTSVVV